MISLSFDYSDFFFILLLLLLVCGELYFTPGLSCALIDSRTRDHYGSLGGHSFYNIMFSQKQKDT